jgi:hypothetical protein
MTVGEITHGNGKSRMNTTVRTGRADPGQAAPATPRAGRGSGAGRPARDGRRIRDGRVPRDARQVPPGRPARDGRPAGAAGPVRTAPAEPAARPAASAAPASPAATARDLTAAGQRPASRTPFILLVLALLVGGLICLLVVNTTLAAASYQISNLQRSNAVATQRVQELQQQVASEQSPGSIEQRALRLGMRMQPTLSFIDLKTGRTYTMPSRAGGASAVPGYTP